MTQTNLQTMYRRPIRIDRTNNGGPVIQLDGEDDANEDGDEDEEYDEEEEEEDWVEDEFVCPITSCVMKTPVVASDGHSYELAAISRWLTRKHTSPFTGAKMASKRLVLNHTLRKVIRNAKAKQRASSAAVAASWSSPTRSSPSPFVPSSPAYSPTSP